MDDDQSIMGYRELTSEEVSEINRVKDTERKVAELWQVVTAAEKLADRRWAAVAKTHFQEGFSALVRAIARPDDPFEN